MARPHIPILNMDEIEPFSRAPGRRSYMLSTDPQTTGRTAVQRVTPTGEFKAEPMAHYHHTTEEILVLEGLLSFDSRIWLPPISYVFHPAEFVHGFASSVPVETLYISRVGRELDFNYVPEPAALTPYFVGERPPSRGLQYRPGALSADWNRTGAGPSGRENWLQILSLDAETGEGSALVRLAAGNSLRPLAGPAGERELFVLEGALAGQDGARFAKYSYACWPDRIDQPGLSTAAGALLYLFCQLGLPTVLEAIGLGA